MQAVLLDAASLGSDISLKPLSDLVPLKVYRSCLEGECESRIKDASIVLTNKVVITKKMMAKAPHLKFIGVLATGMNNIDLEGAKQLGIHVQNVSDYCSDSVAQHWLSCVLALSHSLVAYQKDVANGLWSQSPTFCLLDHPILSLKGKKLLIIGYGNLGRAVAALAYKSFAMEILVVKRPSSVLKEDALPVKETSLEDGLAAADIVSLHCPLTQETENLMDKRRLSLMKTGAILVNTARGGLLDEAALLSALDAGRLGGAAIDVLKREPPEKDNPLLIGERKNLLVTPHIAWASFESRKRLIEKMASHLRAFLEN